MSNLEKTEKIAERLRQEPYVLFKNDCIGKSRRFKRECRAQGIPARVAVCLGVSKARLFGRWLTVPVIHAWGEVEGRRTETSRPLGSSGVCGIVPMNSRPVIALRF